MVEISYVLSGHDLWLTIGGRRLVRVRYWSLPGALLTFAGAVLSGMAESGGPGAGWSVLATVAGGTLLVWPYVRGEQAFRTAARKSYEYHVTVSDTGIRIATAGISSETSWSRIRTVTDTGAHWVLNIDTGRSVYLPKSAVPEADQAELARLLDLAGK